MKKYFPKSVKLVNDKLYIGFKGMRSFYRNQYQLKVCFLLLLSFLDEYEEFHELRPQNIGVIL